MKFYKKSGISIVLINFFLFQPMNAQTNESSVTNSAAPSASSVTTGGTNINYQTNNAYNNEMGFGGGIFCRTPTLYIGGNVGQSDLDAHDGILDSGNITNNISLNAGILFPFGSPVKQNCEKIAATITKDRMISSELSMLKACNELYQKNIPVNPDLYPLLKRCENYEPKVQVSKIEVKDKTIEDEKENINKKEKSKLIPKTFRAL